MNFTPKITWNNEIDNRRFLDPDIETQFIFHSRLHYRTGRWDYATGISLSWAYASQAENSVRHAVMEARPVIEASYEIPMRKLFLSQRLRIDNRFIEEDKFNNIFDGSDYIMRLRYRVQTRVPLKRDENGIPLITLRIANEIMVNHRENFFDQNRIYMTSEFIINRHWAFEAGYIYIYQQRFGKDEFFERHVLRLSLTHKLFFYSAG